jgi:OOP family OmpA-OmpF porin
VRLSGHVPSETIKAALAQRARQLFNAQPEDVSALAPGAPQGDWQRAALWGMEQVAQLQRGEARMVDGRIVVIGEGPAAAVEQVKSRAAMGPAPGFEASADVTVTGQGLGIRELQGVDLSNASPEVCTAAFARLMQNNVITFAVDSDVIDPKSAPLLENLVRVAVRCDSAKIEVSGHTDITGDPAQNFALSQRRANAVRLYLIERGVLDDRITAQGFGSTRPVAPNTTQAGQAANRRIEFRVSS